MADDREFVLLLHGVNSSGAWQRRLALALEPFARCRQIRYGHYRWFFGSELVLEPFVAVPGVAAAVLAGWWWAGAGVLAGIALPAVGGVGAVGLAYAMRHGRRRRALAAVYDKIRAALQGRTHAHAVAHSFGTYLLGYVLLKHESLQFGQVIFTGCVLKRDFPWPQLFSNRPEAAQHVRNEVGQRDRVVRRAGQYGPYIAEGLGDAGVHGFDPSPYVHATPGLWGDCLGCGHATPGHVHDCIHTEGDHHFWDDPDGHALTFWYPTLLELPCKAFREFHNLCSLAERARQQDRPKQRAEVVARLSGPWPWYGQRLDAHLYNTLRLNRPIGPASNRAATQQVERVLEHMITLVCAAQDAVLSRRVSSAALKGNAWPRGMWRLVPAEQRWRGVVQAFHPEKAVKMAVKHVAAGRAP